MSTPEAKVNYDERPSTYGNIAPPVAADLIQRFRQFQAAVHRAYLEADHELYNLSKTKRGFTRKQALNAHERVARFYAFDLRVRLFRAAEKGHIISADLVARELSQLSCTGEDELAGDVEAFKQTLFLDRHCDLPLGTVTESELHKTPPKLYDIAVQAVVPDSVFHFKYADAMTRSRDPSYRHEEYIVDLSGDFKILDMADDDCVCGGVAFCYIQ